jgi:hypothetical protein
MQEPNLMNTLKAILLSPYDIEQLESEDEEIVSEHDRVPEKQVIHEVAIWDETGTQRGCPCWIDEPGVSAWGIADHYARQVSIEHPGWRAVVFSTNAASIYTYCDGEIVNVEYLKG